MPPENSMPPENPVQQGNPAPVPAPQVAEPPRERREHDGARTPTYEPRADGGFGPKGSGGLGASGRSPHGGRGPAQWSGEEDQRDDQDRAAGAFRGEGAFRRRESDDDGPPQFLVEADDLSDGEYGESRLVAPPVLGEAPPSYRDF